MGTTSTLPTPARIHAYLTSHGWRKGWDLPESGEMFVFKELDDDGEEITVFVAKHPDYDDYRQRVADVVETLAWIERRPKDAVWADLCGAGPVNGTIAPTAPAETTAPDTSPQPTG
jgi:hypothetical protein